MEEYNQDTLVSAFVLRHNIMDSIDNELCISKDSVYPDTPYVDHLTELCGLSASLDSPVMNIHHTYHVIMPDSGIFIISDIQMKMTMEYTMFAEGHGCHLGSYRVNGIPDSINYFRLFKSNALGHGPQHKY